MRAGEHLLQGSRHVAQLQEPTVGLVFGDVDAFALDMFVELHEHSPAFATSVQIYDEIMSRPLADILWYPAYESPEPSDIERAAATIAVTVGATAVFLDEYDFDIVRYAGVGIGAVAAAIATGVVSLSEALRWLAIEHLPLSEILRTVAERGESTPALFIAEDPADLAEILDEADAIVDVGPGDSRARELRQVVDRDTPVASWDSSTDRLRIRDNILRRPFCNARYLTERTLGQITATRMVHDSGEGHTRIRALARRLKSQMRASELSAGGGAGAIADAVSVWIENARVKGYAQEKILESIVSLEHETLFAIRRVFDLDEAGLAQYIREESNDAA